ncbi:MAG: T9SS type A sorting domain-containing protein [Cytophagales bacterium]|nr:T9SS type A sorting domain-containing protein [Cytophagales bacterium]
MKKIFTSLFILLSFYGFSQNEKPYISYSFSNNLSDGNGVFDLTPTGGSFTSDRFGNANSAYDLSQGDHYLNTFNPTALPDLSGQELTISYWFKGTKIQSAIRQQGGGGFIVAGWTAGCGFDSHIISTLTASDCDKALSINSDGININDGKWHHIAMTFKTGGAFKSYVDNILIAEKETFNTTIPKVNAQLVIGAWTSAPPSEFMDGIIDDIKIYKRELSAEELKFKPAAPVVESISGCSNEVLNMVAQGENIKWYADEAKTNLVFEGNSYTPTSVQEGENTYWVTQTVDGAESDVVKATLTVLASVKDAPKPTTTSLVEFCQGNVSSSEVSVGTIPNAESYEWTLTPQNAGTISGQGDKVTINWSIDFFGEATIKVAGKNTCGLGKESEGLKFNILEKPIIFGKLNNYTKYCEGQFIVLDAGSGYDSYLWNTGSTEQIEVIKSDFVGKGNHTYSVTATKGACSTTENVTVSIDLVTSAPSLVIEKSNVNVYPNPANDQLNIDFDNIHNEEVLTFELVNTNGNVVLEEEIIVFDKNFSHSTNVNGISSGLYIIKIQGNTFSHQAKVIIE